MRLLRILTTALAAALALWMLPVTALAAGTAEIPGAEGLGRELPGKAGEILGDMEPDEGFDASRALERLRDAAVDAVGGILRSSVSAGTVALAAAMLCAGAGALCPERREGVDYVDLVGVLAITAASASGAATLIGEAARCVDELWELATLILPVLASASAMAGEAASGAARYAASALFLDVLATAGRRVILPLIYMYLAAGAANAAFGGAAGAQKLIEKLVRHLLAAAVTAFTLYLTLTGIMAAPADAAAVKLTRTAMSTLLPVVGGMVADAADAVVSGVGVIRGALGAFGAAAVLAVCLLPVLKLMVNAFVYHAAAELARPFAAPRITGLIDTVGTACSLALGLAGAEAVMLLISVIAAARALGA